MKIGTITSLCVTVRKLPSQFDQKSHQLLQFTASGKATLQHIQRQQDLYVYIFHYEIRCLDKSFLHKDCISEKKQTKNLTLQHKSAYCDKNKAAEQLLHINNKSLNNYTKGQN